MSPKPLRATSDLPGTGGFLSPDPEDFRVEERLPYEATGAGSHLFVRFEKVDLTSWAAVRALCDHWNVPEGPESAGLAGLKDRAAVAIQWASLPWPESRPAPQTPASVPVTGGPGRIQVWQARRHPHKLRTGHVANNRFRIRIRGVYPEHLGQLEPLVRRLREVGMPNRFGPQRFGRHGDNPEEARRILRRDRRVPRDRRKRRLLLSALQSELFNDLLDRRLLEGTWQIPQLGDLLVRHGRGALFHCADLEAERARAARLEVSPSGPLFGKKMRRPAGEPDRWEREVWRACGLDDGAAARLGPGGRRALRVPVADLRTEAVDDGYVVQVSLPSGSYATVLLDELVKPAEGPFRRLEHAAGLA